jgi:ATP synthase F1 delta subunit
MKEAETEKDRLLKQARSQSEEIIQQADRSRQLLITELEERIAKGAVEKACELIQTTLPEQFKRDVHSQWIEKLISESFEQLKHLQVPKEIREVKVTSAFSLTEEQRKNLSKKLKQLLGREIVLNVETDSKIVVGLIITIGSLVLDGSLKNKIQKHAQGMGG